MRSRDIVFAACLGPFMVSACGGQDDEIELGGRTFKIERAVIDGEEIDLRREGLAIEFGSADVTMQTPCSPLTGKYVVRNERLVLGNSVSVGGFDGCTQSSFDQMDALRDVFVNEPNIVLSDGDLTLTRERSTIEATERP